MFFISDKNFTDRYDLAKFLNSEDGVYTTIDSLFIYELLQTPAIGYIVSTGERPEILSYKVYDDVQFYMILMLYNNITDFSTDLTVGTIIKYPSLSSLELLISDLKARQKAEAIINN